MDTILAVDPGKTTGLAWMDVLALTKIKMDERFAHLVEWTQIEGSVGDQCWKIGRGVVKLNVRCVISESSDHFVLNPMERGHLTKASLVPIKLSGGLQAMCAVVNKNADRLEKKIDASPSGEGQKAFEKAELVRCSFVEQTPSQAKLAITDGVLDEYGFVWRRGKDRHAADAIRHLLLFRRRYMESKRVDSEFWRAVGI